MLCMMQQEACRALCTARGGLAGMRANAGSLASVFPCRYYEAGKIYHGEAINPRNLSVLEKLLGYA
jgi:hypothetical protein